MRCFAAVREALGADAVAVELPVGATVADLHAELVRRAPALQRLPVAFAVNRAYAGPATVLRDGDEVAPIPPISGGSPAARAAFVLQREPLDPRVVIGSAAGRASGRATSSPCGARTSPNSSIMRALPSPG